jgi:hypothetical protein
MLSIACNNGATWVKNDGEEVERMRHIGSTGTYRFVLTSPLYQLEIARNFLMRERVSSFSCIPLAIQLSSMMCLCCSISASIFVTDMVAERVGIVLIMVNNKKRGYSVDVDCLVGLAN